MRTSATRTEDQSRHSEIVLIQEPVTWILGPRHHWSLASDILKRTFQTGREFVIDWQLMTDQRRIEKRFPFRHIGLEERVLFTERTNDFLISAITDATSSCGRN